jgi:hypothetical protein
MDKLDFLENFLPSSPLFYLYYLLFFVVFGLFLIFLISKLKKEEKKEYNRDKKLTIDELIKIAKNKKSTQKDLLFALVAFNENFSVEGNEKRAFELFRAVLNHENRNKAVFDFFHGNVIPKNLKYKNELDKLEKEALNK